MIFFDPNLQKQYKKKDPILKLLESSSSNFDNKFTSHQWLLESITKRMIYFYMYGDLLSENLEPKTVLDVGGGYSSLTKILLKKHNYTLLDLMAHDSEDMVEQIQSILEKRFWRDIDWYDFEPRNHYDLIIANDLFPNVDQRLETFFDKYLPLCDELRLLITYYNTSRWYKVKRIGADEIFHMMAWNGVHVKQILKKYIDSSNEKKLNQLLGNPPSLFSNNRQVCMIKLRGGKIIRNETI